MSKYRNIWTKIKDLAQVLSSILIIINKASIFTFDEKQQYKPFELLTYSLNVNIFMEFDTDNGSQPIRLISSQLELKHLVLDETM